MAFTSTIIHRDRVGTRYETWGTFTNTSGSTGGDIETGLGQVEFFVIQELGSSVTTGRSVVNNTFSLTAGYAGTLITIVTDADVDGLWQAKGFL